MVGAAVVLGSLVQGLSGFGLGLTAAPVVAFVDPTLVPAALLIVIAPLPLLTAWRERAHIVWRQVWAALLGRLPGTAVGIGAVALLSPRAIALVVAVVVLLGVAASLVRWDLRPTRASLLVAGGVSGAMATATSIGGPPMALVYQRSGGPTARATMGAFFGLGLPISLGVLIASGQVGTHALVSGLLLLPAMALGFAASGPLRPLVDTGGRFRTVVLTVTAASGAALLVRTLAG